MRPAAIALFSMLALGPVTARAAPTTELRLGYNAYAAGLHVAAVQADLALGGADYQLQLAYHTTGLMGFFRHGHQLDRVNGVWSGNTAEPLAYQSSGRWGGKDRLTLIEYRHGEPVVRAQQPPDAKEREPVPAALQAHSIDSLSALAVLMRQVARTGRCDLVVRTYDGRRASEVSARTVGYEMLPKTGRSIFRGPALRCDFVGRLLAGFKRGEDGPAAHKPLRGSAWFARTAPGAPVVPVRMAFQTRWFGEATMYLVAAQPVAWRHIAQRRQASRKVARGHG